MLDDAREVTPGTASYWTQFYSDEGEVGSKPSLIPKYDWFMPFDEYADKIIPWFESEGRINKRELRVLHVGCGNSPFADEISGALEGGNKKKKKEKSAGLSIVNTDICVELMTQMQQMYPGRQYAVGDVCNLRPTSLEMPRWWCLEEKTEMLSVESGKVDIVFDKGTLDALLSAFSHLRGDASNPNARRYCQEMLRVLRKPGADNTDSGGLIILISINSRHVVEPYFYLAGCGDEESTSTGTTSSSDDENDAKVLTTPEVLVDDEEESFGFKLVCCEDLVYDRGTILSEEGYDSVSGPDWIHSYGTHYTMFVFQVEQESS